ncbi:TIM-barrel domain-containing protein [Poseidonocella sp. HB161398]|uniref:glycoside hydrolase family 31 protein n=1 Tax=Poseidonocella sp. HB161398 TaxID=2320855 RepID=UPI001108ABF7|nr:glycoside hydrolase family 31 protein [Poseidonocella sp. HB161398]
MKTLTDWTLKDRTETGVEILIDGRHLLLVAVLDETLFRVSLLKDGNWRLNRGWCVAPDGEMPWEGRLRDDLSGHPCPDFAVEEGESLAISTASMRLVIEHPLRFVWQRRDGDGWAMFAEERPTGGVMLGLRDNSHGHFLRRFPGEKVYGLGEKAGDLERSGRRYEMRNLDAMGYDAETTDPLYKHIPFTLTKTPEQGCWSVYYDNMAGAWFDLGNELDNYHLAYRAYRAEDGDLDYYMRWAPSLTELVKGQVRLTGGTAFPPRWSLGYSGSTMSYTDAPDAQAQLESFLARIEEHDIPCDSFQMSSGYTSIGPKRYVFNWNFNKCPDPKAMSAKFAASDVHLIANIKPCLLQDHPRYAEAAEAGLFVRASLEMDPDCGPEHSIYWDDTGSHLDFTNPGTVDWWKDGVSSQLLDYGIGSTWNDNNEYEIWDGAAQCAGFGDAIDVSLIRPVHSVLMTRASEEAQRAHAPEKRPYLISRSGMPGIQRHAQTWTGDNRTMWKTIRYNIRMGLGLSMSGIYNIGHDVGGFSGPRPEPELFVRWVQNGIFHPRFTIHSWNDDATVNEPWMFPEVTHHIRDAIKLRYRLLPYLYTLLWQAAEQDEPMIRPAFMDFPEDEGSYAECDDFLLGRDLLVANVVEEGAATRTVRLPKCPTGWWDFHAGTWHEGGSTLVLDVDLGSMPLFVRGGAVIPMGNSATRAHPQAETERVLAVFPAPGAFEEASVMYEDDGVTEGGASCVTTLTLKGTAEGLSLAAARSGEGAPVIPVAKIVLPAGETRSLPGEIAL